MTPTLHASEGRRTVLTGALNIVAAAILLGSVANLVSPNRIRWAEDWSHYIESRALKAGITLITATQANDFFQDGRHIFMDARPADDFQKGRIPSAFSVPYENVEEAILNVQMFLTPEQPIVTYCSGESCDESFLLTEFLRAQGFTNVVLFAGGMEAWRQAEYRVEGGP